MSQPSRRRSRGVTLQAVHVVHAAGIGTVLSILTIPQKRAPELAAAVYINVVHAILTDAPTPAPANGQHLGAGIVLRATLDSLDKLKPQNSNSSANGSAARSTRSNTTPPEARNAASQYRPERPAQTSTWWLAPTIQVVQEGFVARTAIAVALYCRRPALTSPGPSVSSGRRLRRSRAGACSGRHGQPAR